MPAKIWNNRKETIQIDFVVKLTFSDAITSPITIRVNTTEEIIPTFPNNI
jgi:hypothetical protein